MELIVQEIPKIEPIRFNYEELKAELTERVEAYKTIAYTADTIKEAKADRAKLNALKKSLNDERIRLEREYMEPFQMFKSQVTDLVMIVDEASKAIDIQVKEYEELKKAEKRDQIKAIFDHYFEGYQWLTLEMVWDEKWLNATTSLKKIDDALFERKDKIESEIGVLSRLPEYSFEAIETYKRTLKIDDALWTADNLKQMAEAKKVAEAIKSQPTEDVAMPGQMDIKDLMPTTGNPPTCESEPPREWVSFRVFLTWEEAVALNHYFKAHNIQFEQI